MTQNNPKFFLDKITRNENCKKSKNSFRDHDHDHTHAHKTKTTNSEGYEKFKIEKMTPNHQIMEKRNNDFTWITNSDEKRKKNRHLLTKNKNKEHLISQIIKNSLDNNYYFIPNQKKIILNKPPLNISYSHSFKNPGKNHLQKKVRSSQFHKVSLFFSLSNDPCLSYNQDYIFENEPNMKQQISKKFFSKILYLETSRKRYELLLNKNNLFQLSLVKNPCSYKLNSMIFNKEMPIKDSNKIQIKNNIIWDDIQFNKSNVIFDQMKIFPIKMFWCNK